MHKAHRNLLCLGALVLVVVVFFFPLLQGKTFSTVAGYQNSVYPWAVSPNSMPFTPQSDQAELSYPWQAFIQNSWKKNVLPLWNPYSFFGEPFFSNGSSGLFYPPRFFASILGLSPSLAHDLLSVVVVLGSGVFMFFFMRALRCRRMGALLAATVWMLASFNLAWLHLEVSSPLTLFLPLDCWCVLRAVRSRTWSSFLWAWAMLAMTLASGHLPFLGLVFATAVAYAVALEVGAFLRTRREKGLGLRDVLRIGAFPILPPLLAAVVLVPTLLTIHASMRGSSTYAMLHESLRVAPQAFLYTFWPASGQVSEKAMHEMAFVGTVVPFLAFFGLLRRKPGWGLFTTIAVIIPLLLLDTPLLRLVFAVCPWIGIVHDLGRLFFLWNFALAGLTGIGLEHALARLRIRSRRRGTSKRGNATLILAAALVILVTGVQLAAYGHKINPSFHPRQRAFLFPDTPVIESLRRLDPSARIVPLSPKRDDGGWMRPIFNGATSMVWDIPSAGGYDSVIPARTYRLLEVVRGRSLQEVLNMSQGGTVMAGFNPKSIRFDLLPRLGITYLVGTPTLDDPTLWPATGAAPLELAPVYKGPDGIVWRIIGAPQGPRVVRRAVVADGPDRALAAVVDRQEGGPDSVILERQDVGEAIFPASSGTDAKSGASVRHRTNNEILIEATSPGPAFLVIPESWDAGWTATVNGRRWPILHADYAFRAVRIPEGTSEVRLSYVPAGLRLGFLITILSGAVSIFLARLLAHSRNSKNRRILATVVGNHQ